MEHDLGPTVAWFAGRRDGVAWRGALRFSLPWLHQRKLLADPGAVTEVDGVRPDGQAIIGPMPGAKYTRSYNSEKKDLPWDERVGKTIPSVRYYLSRWLGNLDASP